VTLDLGVMSSSLTLGVEITKINKLLKKVAVIGMWGTRVPLCARTKSLIQGTWNEKGMSGWRLVLCTSVCSGVKHRVCEFPL